MSIHENSIQSYYDHINSGAKLKQVEKVLKFIEFCGEHTAREVAASTAIDYSDVKARVSELIKEGALEEVRRVRCPVSSKMVRVVDVIQPKNQKDLDI